MVKDKIEFSWSPNVLEKTIRLAYGQVPYNIHTINGCGKLIGYDTSDCINVLVLDKSMLKSFGENVK